MTNIKPLRHRSPLTPHLSAEQLLNFRSGQVTPAEKRTLEQHLQHCRLCTDALEGFAYTNAATLPADILELNHLIRKRTARRKTSTLLSDVKTWGFATAIIFLLIISAAIVWNVLQHTNQAPNVAPPAAKITTYAQPVKGYALLKTYLTQQAKNIDLPSNTARKKGQVILSFVVNPDSTLSTFAVVKSLGKPYDQAAIEFVKQGPAWKPAIRQGTPKAQKVTLRVYFK